MENNCNHKWVLVSDIFNSVVPDDDGSVTEVRFGVYKCAICKSDINIQIEPDYTESLNEYLDKICDNDKVTSSLIYEYFINNLKYGENNTRIIIGELYKNKPVFDEFIKFLTFESYDYDEPLIIRNHSVKTIREENPNMTDLEVFEAFNFLYVRNEYI